MGIICFFILITLHEPSSTNGSWEVGKIKDLSLNSILNCNTYSHNDSILVDDLQSRAMIMRWVKWTPKHSIPNNTGAFSPGKTLTGLPYSSVKELQKFIGLDVSIYTFLTAVNNPHSLLYTEDVAEGNPCYLGGIYNGKNCHTFYGTVCSSFTAFCYGENYNYTSYNYRDGQVPHYYLKPDQSLENISAGDLFWCPGHVALIYNVERNSLNKVNKIELFESVGTRVSSKSYTPSKFLQRLSGNGNEKKKGYLYGNSMIEFASASKLTAPSKKSVELAYDSIQVNNDEICTWFGDRPCIGEWDKLVINFNKKNFDRIIISQNNEVVDTLDITQLDHSIEYNFKGTGIYEARLATTTTVSPKCTSFEIIDTSTKVIDNKDGTSEIYFAENSNPEIVFWVNKNGYQLSFPNRVTNKDKGDGKMKIKTVARKDAMVRVIYSGEYGRSINKPEYLFKKN